MRLYISSSKRNCKADSWLLTWLVCFAIAGSVLLAMEVFFRARGHRPSVIDDKLLWAYNRHRIYDNGKKKTIVLLGQSRIQVGFMPSVFEQRFPEYRIVQLAIDGSGPYAALRDLANDERFTGIVIASVSPVTLRRDHREDQQSYVDFYNETYLGGCYIDDEFNRSVSTFFQKNFVVTNHELRLDNIATNLIRKKSLPPKNYIVTQSNRSRPADYTKLDIIAHRRERIQIDQASYADCQHPAPDDWLDQAMETDPLVRAIQRRGGQVVFIEYITTDKHYELQEKHYPKSEYWDRFAKMSNAVTIHFKDVPGLSDFDCPDTSHLDFRDAPHFTALLSDELRRLGVIR